MEKEKGFPICSDGKGITKGKTVTGGPHAVSVPLLCPPNLQVIGVHHSHPGGSLQLSRQDIRTAKDKNLSFVCVKAKGKVRCYKFGDTTRRGRK